MSNSSTLPPQAYTREILAQAFLWIQRQPESLRSMAGTPDALVGLYLRAKRNGEVTLESSAPVSSEDFRANLKTLATELNQFSIPPTVPKPQPQVNPPPEIPSIPTPVFTQSGGYDQRTQEILSRTRVALNLSSDTEALRMLVTLGFERVQALFKKDVIQ